MTQPGFGEHLRYIGRDGATGLPARVNDTFIAETEKAIQRYGQDASEPVPPPPAGPVDIVSVSVPRLGLRQARVGRYGLDAFGRLDVPQDTSTIGWNPAYCALPGEGGDRTFIHRSQGKTRSRLRQGQRRAAAHAVVHSRHRVVARVA